MARGWRAVLAATVVFGFAVHAIVGGDLGQRGGRRRRSERLDRQLAAHWVIVPANADTSGNVRFVALLCLVVALVQVTGRLADDPAACRRCTWPPACGRPG